MKNPLRNYVCKVGSMVMRKKNWYKSLILGACICLLTGCNSVGSQETMSCNETIEAGTSDIPEQTISENYTSEIASENSEIVTNKKFELKDEVEAALGYIPDEYQKDKEYDDWFEKYSAWVFNISYIKYPSVIFGNDRYWFVYLDDDDIPELIFDDGYYYYIYTLNGDTCNFGKRDFIIAYSEGSGKLLIEYFYDGTTYIEGYTYNKGNKEFILEVEADKTGEYDILGYPVSLDSYNLINDFIDLDSAKKIRYDNCYSTVEILYVMKTGHDSSYTHRYEVIYDDVTWEEAQEICEEKGGYLAAITSWEELYRIKELFSDRDELAVCYIGCRGTISDHNQCWILNNNNTIDTGGGGIYIFDYGKDNHTYLLDNLGLDECEERGYGILVYGKNRYDSDSDYQVDMLSGPNDIVASNPSLSGKVGFICEYDE